jgi:hypothetical protein
VAPEHPAPCESIPPVLFLLDCGAWKYQFTEPGKSAPILVPFSALIHPGSAASRHAIPSPRQNWS